METTDNTIPVMDEGIKRGILEVIENKEEGYVVYQAYSIMRNGTTEYLGRYKRRGEAEYDAIQGSFREPLD